MQKQAQTYQRLTPRQVGLLFLIPGLLWGVPALLTGNFTGAAMGFCTFAVLFGTLMLLISVVKPNYGGGT